MSNFFAILFSRLAVDKTLDEYKKSQKENVSVLKYPKLVFVIGAGSMILWGVAILAVLFFVKDSLSVIMCLTVFGSLFLLGLLLVLIQRNYLVIYRKAEIVHRNLFGKVRHFQCKDIVHVHYRDGGGVRFLFNDGKKLSFSENEAFFYDQVLKKEHLQCHFADEGKPLIQVQIYPLLRYLLWALGLGTLLLTVYDPDAFLLPVIIIGICTGMHFSYTTYNRNSKILTRKVCGFSRSCDMHGCTAEPVYNDGFLMAIEIFRNSKRIMKIPVSREYKNRAKLIKELCGNEL